MFRVYKWCLNQATSTVGFQSRVDCSASVGGVPPAALAQLEEIGEAGVGVGVGESSFFREQNGKRAGCGGKPQLQNLQLTPVQRFQTDVSLVKPHFQRATR